MLDPKLLRDNPDKIRKMLEARAVEFPLDQLINVDEQRRDLIIRTDEIRKKRNEIALEIARKKKANGDVAKIIEQMQSVYDDLRKLEEIQVKDEEIYKKICLSIPKYDTMYVSIAWVMLSTQQIKHRSMLR